MRTSVGWAFLVRVNVRAVLGIVRMKFPLGGQELVIRRGIGKEVVSGGGVGYGDIGIGGVFFVEKR